MFSKLMFEGAKQSALEVLMLSKALFCRYAQTYRCTIQQADWSNYKKGEYFQL